MKRIFRSPFSEAMLPYYARKVIEFKRNLLIIRYQDVGCRTRLGTSAATSQVFRYVLRLISTLR